MELPEASICCGSSLPLLGWPGCFFGLRFLQPCVQTKELLRTRKHISTSVSWLHPRAAPVMLTHAVFPQVHLTSLPYTLHNPLTQNSVVQRLAQHVFREVSGTDRSPEMGPWFCNPCVLFPVLKTSPLHVRLFSWPSCFLRCQTEEEEHQNSDLTINSAMSLSSYITSKMPPHLQVIQVSSPPSPRALTWQERQR